MGFNCAQAFREGWTLSERDDGMMQIQRLDDPRQQGAHYPERSPFVSDAEALAFVRGEGIRCGGYHAQAFLLHGSRPNAPGSSGRLVEPAKPIPVHAIGDEEIPSFLKRK